MWRESFSHTHLKGTLDVPLSEEEGLRVVSEEHKKKLSESLKGIKRSEETRRKISEARRRKTEHKKGL